jgi:hypothetical protein
LISPRAIAAFSCPRVSMRGEDDIFSIMTLDVGVWPHD